VAGSQAVTIDSAAFRNAVLRSERLRLLGLLAVLAAGLVLVLLRAAIAPDAGEQHLALVMAVISGAAAAYEAVALRALDRALGRGDTRAPLSMVAAPVVETLVPTLALLATAHAANAGPQRALAGPPVVVFYLLIMLSILRLTPALSLFTGVASAAGYAAVWVFGIAAAAASGPNLALARGIFAAQSGLMVVAGALAAAVAFRVRGHVAAALREAEARREVERYQGELNLARQIQQGLLPAAAPALGGFDVAGWNRPADETGGDYFDFVDAGGGAWVVVVADVTGHGIAAALIMAACRAYLRACLTTTARLADAMTTTSERLLGDLPRGKFVTLAALRCGIDSSEAELLSAGHGPLLLYRDADRTVTEITAHGIPLAMLPGFPYAKSSTLRLAPGDMLVMLTDGFWEWEDGAGEQFGLERLKVAIVASAGRPAGEVIAQLAAAVEGFAAGARQGDDLTAVVVRKV
jgi:serine phosphatase RsbU (regulator of sigma subunit)